MESIAWKTASKFCQFYNKLDGKAITRRLFPFQLRDEIDGGLKIAPFAVAGNGFDAQTVTGWVLVDSE